MKKIIISYEEKDYEVVVRESRDLLKLVGVCKVVKTPIENKQNVFNYSIVNIQMLPVTQTIVAVGYPTCNSMVNNTCYNNQKILGSIDKLPVTILGAKVHLG